MRMYVNIVKRMASESLRSANRLITFYLSLWANERITTTRMRLAK